MIANVEQIEGGVVTAVIVLNIVIGFGQEYQGPYGTLSN
jgi:hypothetical protein